MTLTEQWKKGELSDGMYYMENASGIIGIVGHSKAFPCYNVKQVLAEVPTYQEYLESESHCAVYSDINKWLKEENKQLRQLLKECQHMIIAYSINNNTFTKDEVKDIITKIDEVLK